MRFGLHFIGVIVALACPECVWAHALGVECSLRGGKVHVEAFYDDDTPAQFALVEIRDSTKMLFANGKTDAKGLWSFEAPPPGNYEVFVNAGAGHAVQKALTVPARTPTVESPKLVISQGQTREEFTGFPIIKVGIALGTLALFTIAFLIARRRV
ncbi:MAG: carboxypeptidase-like regulatory domain-containing protein [Gemmataceae bacterium]|nr:carboxypeptidase-like regulatory domain-containing protein [Gemmataceae bacterium]MCI0738032.1 carboxypeptidase-like regulatory domain-containing protein [Gemmataceae bacterium]